MVARFGFDFKDPYFCFDGLEFAFRVCTIENVYGIDPAAVVVTEEPGLLRLETDRLQFAGGQRKCEGRIVAELRKVGSELRFKLDAGHAHPIKCTTILVRGLPSPDEEEKDKIYTWPSRDLWQYPFPAFEQEVGPDITIAQSDTTLRFRRWARYRDYLGHDVFNLSEDAPRPGRSRETPGTEWILRRDRPADDVQLDWYRLLEAERGLLPWDRRTDVPRWANDIGLVLNMHCEGWTGYVFNTFDRQLEILRWIGERIDGRNVLVYLAGWDGRYYWDYPLYEPSEACGGADALRRLVDGAHEMGMHVVPMFGMIASSRHNTVKLGFEDAVCRTVYDLEEFCDWTEWDEDLSNDPIWQPLNLGHPKWRKYLLDQVCSFTDAYETDGVMLDISLWLPRDPRHDMFGGLLELLEKLRSRYEDFLVYGENGTDLHLPLFPIFQHLAYLPAEHPFHKYCKSSDHLYSGAPGENSTGVFESGWNQYRRPSPDRPSIPTLGIVHNTLPDHADEVAAVLKVARQWLTTDYGPRTTDH